MTTTKILMPQLGESVSEGTVSRWLVKPGEHETVQVGTELAFAEIAVGETARLGPLATAADGKLFEGAQSIEPKSTDPLPEGRISPAAAKLARDHGIDISGVRGTGLGGRVSR